MGKDTRQRYSQVFTGSIGSSPKGEAAPQEVMYSEYSVFGVCFDSTNHNQGILE
jgi:hypothetical protein